MTEQVEVTQVDREAAAAVAIASDLRPIILEGRMDGHIYTQAFARHRIAAQAETRSQVEQRFWAIVDPNAVPSDMWEALNRMAQAYRTQSER